MTGNGTQFSSALDKSESMAFNKRASNTDPGYLTQHPRAPPRSCMVAKDIWPPDLPLGLAKPTTQQKVAFHLFSFLDTTPGDPSSHPAKTD